MLPIVTMSPSRSFALVISVPLTKVPLLLSLSRISRPAGVNVSIACTREASASSTTMLLVLARPIVAEPWERAGAGRLGRGAAAAGPRL